MALDQATVERASRLAFHARRVVEGLRAGPHKSPLFGSSVEFAEHKEYTPGDDLRYIDWKLYGKADRWYIKRFEEETNLTCWLLVDQSASMTWAGGGATAGGSWWRRLISGASAGGAPSELGPGVPDGSKLAWATLLAASISHLLTTQGDQVGLVTFGGGAPAVLAPRSQPSHLHAILRTLVNAPAAGEADLAKALGDFAPRLRQRGVVVVISDLLEDVDGVFQAMRALRPHRQDVVLFHVLDPDELTFPYKDVSRFVDPEDPSRQLLTDPKEIREAYLEVFRAFLEDVRRRCLEAQVEYVLADTSVDVGPTLAAWLARRAAQDSGRRRGV